MRRASTLIAVAPLALLGTVASGQDPTGLPPQERYVLRLQYREYRPSLSGETQRGSETREGTLIDLDDDLAIADKRTFDLRATLQFKKGRKLRGSYTPLDYKGDTESSRPFNYGNTRFGRFERVVSSMKGGYYSADLEWDFVKNSHGFLGAVLGAKLFDVDAAVVSPTQGTREVDTLRVPIPVIGVATRFYARRFSFEGEISGLTAGSHGSMYEAEGSLRAHLTDHLAGMVGYRYLSMNGRDGSDELKMHLGGWQFGLEISL